MGSKQSLLKATSIDILPNLSVRIPTVGEILDDEENYYSIVSALTATPYQYRVQLDDIGKDFTTVKDYELFRSLFPIYAKSDLSILFGDLVTSDFGVYTKNDTGEQVLYSPSNQIIIDELVYNDLAECIRKINGFEKFKGKPGNEAARKYLIQKERKRQKRHAKKPYEPYLENMVIALVNTEEFPYDYDSCMDLSIYRFNQSLKQIQHKKSFDKTMIGVYAGTVDTSKITNKNILSWVQMKE